MQVCAHINTRWSRLKSGSIHSSVRVKVLTAKRCYSETSLRNYSPQVSSIKAEAKDKENGEKKRKAWGDIPAPSENKWKRERERERERDRDRDRERDRDRDDRRGGDNTPETDNLTKAYLTAFGVVTLVTVALVWLGREGTPQVTYIQFQNELLAAGYVGKLELVNGKKVLIYLKNSGAPAYHFTILNEEELTKQLTNSLNALGLPADYIPITYTQGAELGRTAIMVYPTIVLIGAVIFSLQTMVKRSGMGKGGIFSVGKTNAKLINKSTVNVKFKDVAGCEEAKQEVAEFVSFLKNKKRYEALGAKTPKGALLVGPPGTGKTLLAKATAGEADVSFYSVSGSDFIEVFGGVGPARVRDLFTQARKNAPCIIFLDEIDAIGRKRGGIGRNDERENTLNQLLVEMDGFTSNENIIVLAGTNRPDILDRALLRPGRFDRTISIDLPDIKSRVAIFAVHLAKLKLDVKQNVEDLKLKLARLTPGFSGADIANVCNEAALIAARFSSDYVMYDHFTKAIDRVIAGLEKKTKVLSPNEKKIVAYHEAGHALVGWMLEHTDPVLKVSIIPRGQAALGFAQTLPPEERYLDSKEHLEEKICVLLGGRVAEMIFFGDVSSGARDDLEKVTDIAYASILRYGMNPEVGAVNFADQNSEAYLGKPYSNQTSELVDSQVKQLVEACFAKTDQLIKNYKNKLESIAQLLMDKEVIQSDDVKAILGPKVGSDEWRKLKEQVA